jgi:hypothetical protein
MWSPGSSTATSGRSTSTGRSKGRAEVPVAADGAYSLEWWDTYKGIVVRTEKVAAKGKMFVVPLPPLERDVAVKVRKAA